MPFLLAQLSDPHIGADWGYGNPVAGLAAVVEAIRSMRPQPDAIIVSGDLADHASDTEYDLVRELLAPLAAGRARLHLSRRGSRNARRRAPQLAGR